MLKRLGAKSYIDPMKWRQKDIMKAFYSKINGNSISMIERIFTKFVENRDQSKSGGFFKLAMIIGETYMTSEAHHKRIWDSMIKGYGDDENGINTIKMTLGTLLMIITAEDDYHWVWEPDPEKNEKKARNEKPDGNIYYKDPSYRKHSVGDLFDKFNNK